MKPKFKAWDTEQNKWYDPVFEAYKGKLFELLIGMGGDLSMRTIDKLTHESLFKDRFILVQFTGLHDCNGKEIYEGDVLTGNVLVTFYNGSFGYWTKEDSIPEFFMLYRYLNKRKIIGNRYENPELLNK